MELDDAVAARELLYAHEDHEAFPAGSTEPWIANLLGALVVASDAHTVIEIGGFEGYTSSYLLRALVRLPTSRPRLLTVCEIDPQRALLTQRALNAFVDLPPTTLYNVVIEDSLHWLPTLVDESVDFAWIDGCHEKAHVAREIELLWPKMRDKGIMAFHDVFGVTDLQEIVVRAGGYALNLPRLGPAGGLGLIQVRG